MGYRSDVGIICGVNAAKRLEEVFAQYDLYPDATYTGMSWDGNEQKMFVFNYVKWYEDSYDDVDAVMDALRELDDIDDADFSYSYKYIRLGEDDTDIDVRQNNFRIEFYYTRLFCIPDGMEKLEGGDDYEAY